MLEKELLGKTINSLIKKTNNIGKISKRNYEEAFPYEIDQNDSVTKRKKEFAEKATPRKIDEIQNSKQINTEKNMIIDKKQKSFELVQWNPSQSIQKADFLT